MIIPLMLYLIVANFYYALTTTPSKCFIHWLWAFRRASPIIFCRLLFRTTFFRKSNARRLFRLTRNTLELLCIWRILLNIFSPLDLVQIMLVSHSFSTTRWLLLFCLSWVNRLVLVILLDCINIEATFIASNLN